MSQLPASQSHFHVQTLSREQDLVQPYVCGAFMRMLMYILEDRAISSTSDLLAGWSFRFPSRAAQVDLIY